MLLHGGPSSSRLARSRARHARAITHPLHPVLPSEPLHDHEGKSRFSLGRTYVALTFCLVAHDAGANLGRVAGLSPRHRDPPPPRAPERQEADERPAWRPVDVAHEYAPGAESPPGVPDNGASNALKLSRFARGEPVGRVSQGDDKPVLPYVVKPAASTPPPPLNRSVPDTTDAVSRERRAKIVEAFRHAWGGYKQVRRRRRLLALPALLGAEAVRARSLVGEGTRSTRSRRPAKTPLASA